MTLFDPSYAPRRPELAYILRRIGACEEAIRWSLTYGSDWEKALKECDRLDFIIWLACDIAVRGFLPRHALLKPFLLEAQEPLLKGGHEDGIVLVEEYLRWCDSGGTPEQEGQLVTKVLDAPRVGHSLRLVAKTHLKGRHETYVFLLMAVHPFSHRVRDALAPHLIPGLRAVVRAFA